MSQSVNIDHITYDPVNDEFALYLVEDGPWPVGHVEMETCLKTIQDRVLASVDVAIDGELARKYPDSVGKTVRVQVDSPSGAPKSLCELVHHIEDYIHSAADYSKAISGSPYVAGIRVVTGKDLGRFAGA